MPPGVKRIPTSSEWLLKKKCTQCGETKPWARFPVSKRWDDRTVRYVKSACMECHAELNKKYQPAYRERNRDSIRARHNERERRKRAEMRRDRAGNGGRIPAQPLKVLLWQRVMEMDEPSWAELAEQMQDVPERSIRRVLDQENVSYVLADKLCTHFGVRLEELWPDEFEELAA